MQNVLAPLNTHISLLKRRLLIIGATILIFFAGTFTYAADLIEWLSRPFVDDLIFYGPTEALFAAIKVSFLSGIVLSLPMIFYQAWKFIQPGLLQQEQRFAIPIFLLAGFLFALGLTFCNLVILPLVIQFFVGFGLDRELSPQLAVGVFVDFNVKFLLVMGFAFELPLVLTLLAVAGYLTAKDLVRFRKVAILSMLIISAVVTPDATFYTMLLMAVPMMVMYELGVIGARIFGRKKVSPSKPPSSDVGTDDDGPEGNGEGTGTAGVRLR